MKTTVLIESAHPNTVLIKKKKTPENRLTESLNKSWYSHAIKYDAAFWIMMSQNYIY